MTDQELDRILAEDLQVQPSSRFAAVVMKAIREEAATPPPIPFPWLCMLPILMGWGITFAAVVVAAWHDFGVPATRASSFRFDVSGLIAGLGQIFDAMRWNEVGWVALALLLTVVCVGYPLRLVRGSFRRS